MKKGMGYRTIDTIAAGHEERIMALFRESGNLRDRQALEAIIERHLSDRWEYRIDETMTGELIFRIVGGLTLEEWKAL